MWFLANLLIVLMLPALSIGQALDQRKIGLYSANKAGDDCSQTTLELADDNALALGQAVLIPPTDRFGDACQWVVSNDVTMDSPVFIPYDDTPVVKVNAGITLTLQDCPYTSGNYFIIDADESTTGTVAYVTACSRCAKAGVDNYTRCTIGGDVSANFIAELSDVNADANATDDQVVLGDGTEYRGVAISPCNAVTEKLHYDPDTNAFSCQTDASGPTATLDTAFDAGTGEIDSALCGTKPVKVSNGGDDSWERCVDAGGNPVDKGICDGSDCHWVAHIETDRNFIFYDSEAALDMLTIDPDAASRNLMWKFETGYEPLVSAEVVLRVLGNCAVAEEAIATDDPVDEWITCADTVGDAVTFNYKVTTKIAGDSTLDITLLAVNKNAAPTGTYTLACAAQAVRPGTDAYLAHSTTGQQNVSFTTFDTQNRPESATAAFTINGTVAVGAHIKGQCNVTAAPAQIADIRLSGTAVIELLGNSFSD